MLLLRLSWTLKITELRLDELVLSQIFGGLISTCWRLFLRIYSLFGAEILDLRTVRASYLSF